MPSNHDELAVLFSDELLQPNSAPMLDFLDDMAALCPSSPSSPTGAELQGEAEPFTTDDLAVLSDLLGLVTPSNSSEMNLQSSSTSSPACAQESVSKRKKASAGSTPKRRGRKRQREASPWKSATTVNGMPVKSQQQRQKLEISCLKQQVVELEATIERLQQRKLERERLEAQKQEQVQSGDEMDASMPPQGTNKQLWEGVAKRQVLAVHELKQQNEKLRDQVTTHVEELKKLERVARARHLANVSANASTERQKLGSCEDGTGAGARLVGAQMS